MIAGQFGITWNVGKLLKVMRILAKVELTLFNAYIRVSTITIYLKIKKALRIFPAGLYKCLK